MNPVIGQVPLNLEDGRELTLVLDFEALIEAETAYRKPLPQLMTDVASGFAGAGRAMLYGALRAHHAEFSLRDAGELFRTDGDEVNAALERAVLAAFPSPEGPEGKKGENPPSKRSGRSGARPGSIQLHSGEPRRKRSR